MTDEQFKIISNKLDMLMRVIAFSVISDMKKQDQMLFLDKVGFKPKEIADIINTTPNTVRVTLSRVRKSSE